MPVELAPSVPVWLLRPVDIAEIVGAKLWLNQTGYVPLEKIRGFRAPFLIHNPEQRTILQQNGFVYDSRCACLLWG